MAAREDVIVRSLGLSAITVDHDFQSRVATDATYMREFSEAMLRGDVFPNLSVFEDPTDKLLRLADGFHRYGAYKQAAIINPSFNSVMCDIRIGGRREAMVYSACANKKFSIPRNDADKKKSLFMVLDDTGWFFKSVAELSKAVGISPLAVKKWRQEFCDARGVRAPIAEKIKGKPVSSVYGNGMGGWFCYVNGKATYLGTDQKKATKARDLIAKTTEEAAEVNRKKTISSLNDICKWLGNRGIRASSAGNAPMSGLGQAFVCDEGVFVVARFDQGDNVREVVGRLFLNHLKHFPSCPSARQVVVCHEHPGLEAFEVARELGIEFLTPDEFFASLKADGESTPEVAEPPTE